MQACKIHFWIIIKDGQSKIAACAGQGGKHITNKVNIIVARFE